MCDVDAEAVVAAVDAPSIYEIPKVLHAEGLDAYVVRRLGPAVPRRRLDGVGRPARPGAPPEVRRHRRARRQVHRPARRLPLGRRGAARRRVRAPGAGARSGGCSPTRARRRPAPAAALAGLDGIVVPGGFGIRGIEGKLGALRHVRERGIPALGLCLGLQCMVIEAARHLAGIEGANSAEFDPETPHPVIATMADQVGGGRRRGRPRRVDAPGRLPGRAGARLGRGRAPTAARRCPSGTGTATRSTTPTASSSRRPAWSSPATSPDGRLVEFVELPADVHPFYAGTQAHPELKSRPTRAHPLFRAFIGAALAYNAAERLPVEIPEDEPPRRTACCTARAARRGSTRPCRARLTGSERARPVRGRRQHHRVHRQGHRGPRRGDPDERRVDRQARDRRAPRRGRDRRARRRGQCRAGQPVPAGRCGARLDELPAGLLDVEGEEPLDAAQRELAEEAAARRPTNGTCWSTSTAPRA